MDSTLGFSISKLVARFEFYATHLKEIRHNPDERKSKKFFHLELEKIQEATTSGISFPALFLQTPEVDKSGASDNLSENYNFTFVLIVKGNQDRALIADFTKKLSDKIFNRVLLDVAEEIIPGIITGTSEGFFGPVSDGLYGWGVSFGITDAYNGEVDPNDWEDLS